MSKQTDKTNLANLTAYMDSLGIPEDERDELPFSEECALSVLGEFMAWRKGAETEMLDPKKIGKALEVAYNALESNAWISVTEDMPDDDIAVNVVWHYGDEVTRVAHAARWEGKWHVLTYYGKQIGSAIVTHWQHLPKPPTK